VEGARGAALRPILIDRKERHADITSVPRITTLAGLRPLIRSMDSEREQVRAD
jgi:hypothetical protein